LLAMAGGRGARGGLSKGMEFLRGSRTRQMARRGFFEDEGVHTRKGRGGDDPSGSAEPIWAPLGLGFGLRDLVGLRATGPGAPPNIRLKNSGKGRVGL
jgi:hypothetical protein